MEGGGGGRMGERMREGRRMEGNKVNGGGCWRDVPGIEGRRREKERESN